MIPKITDFGLSKMVDVEGHTRSGDVIGTPCYMAPEQAEGRIKDIGPATDVYALGAILYECLAGRPPFKGESAIEVLLQIRSVEPAAPSRPDLKLPRDLETICLKCLEKEPGRRYASAGELAEDLRRFLDDLPILARRVSLVERGFKYVRRRPERATLAVLIVLLIPVLALVVRMTSQADPESDPHLNVKARAILLKYCFACHGRDPAKIEEDLHILDHEQLVNPSHPIIVPGDVKASRLIVRIEDGSMPPEDQEEYPRLSSNEIALLKEWIQSGAPAFAGESAEDRHVEPPAPLAVEVHGLFRDHCKECHSTGKARKGIKILNHDLLVEKRKLVIPGQPDESILFRSLVTRDRTKRMPPPPHDELSTEQIDLVRRWIVEGAPQFPLPRN